MSKAPATKTQTIVRALRRPEGLTAYAAFLLGENHLAGTVLRLRRAGHVVDDEWHTGTTRFGSGCRFKKYRITSPKK